MKLHVLTAVWGPTFIASFCRLTVRTLLAPGNLADIAASHSVRYTIFTTREDIARLEAHAAFQRLTAAVEVRCVAFSDLAVNTRLSSSHWDLWQRGLRTARDAGETIVTVAADHIFSSDTFTRWVSLFEKGYRAIYCPGIQVVRETVEPELAERFPSDGGSAIELTREELHRLVLRHLHPSNIVMMRDSPRAMSHPEYQMRTMDGTGIAMRILASHAVCVDPRHFTLRDDFCPLDRIEDIAFEPCTFASAEPLMKNLQEYYYPWRMDEAAVSHFGRWMDAFATAANRRESQITHFLDFGRPDPARHRRADLASAAYIAQMNLSRSVYRLWHGLKDRGLHEASRWLAAAHMHGRLRRRLVLRGEATLFVPCDSALRDIGHDVTGALLAASGRALITALRDHVAPGHPVPPGTRRLQVGGKDGAPLLSGRRIAAGGEIRILRGPFRIDGLYVYVVDRPLADLPGYDASEGPVAGYRMIFDDRKRLARATAMRTLRNWKLLRRIVAGLRAGPGRIGRAEAAVPYADALRDAITRRARETLGEVFDFYQDRGLSGSGLASRPREVLADLIARTPGDTAEVLAAILETDPDCAEAWYERAALLQRQGDLAGAGAAYDRAIGGRPALARGPHDADVRVIAALARAQLLADAGRTADALGALDHVARLAPLPWRYHVARARLLIALDHPLNALASFENSMAFDRVFWSLPNLPKKAADIGMVG